MSFSGDFSKLNAGVPLVKILGTDNLSVVFYKLRIEMVGGFMETVNVPLITDEFAKIFQKPFVVEILGDWTRGVETVAIDNVEFYY